ncbi:MAG: outer membrane protein assembly factor BamE, partial [Mariprofundaceae bacterium]|nr:outer membrane protein assembly factor BamE [Mariprofundaceae bacterium]
MKHPLRKHSRRKQLLLLSGLIMLLPLSACMKVTTQQGIVLNSGNLAQIQVQDSRYQVETLLGTPVLRDDLHPNRSIYVDEYNNPDTGETR